jgi:hypothetical protein
MSFRPHLPAAWLGILLTFSGASRAEDPFLGQIKEIKCVNCKPGWVTLVVHDPIDTRDFELYLKDTDYNKIITPLPGKRIHDRNGECFYWMQKPRSKPVPKPGSSPASADPPAKGGVKPMSKAGTAAPDSLLLAGTAVPDSGSIVPPPLEDQGTPSTCIRFYRQMN